MSTATDDALGHNGKHATRNYSGEFSHTNALLITISRFIETRIDVGADGKIRLHYDFDWGTPKKHATTIEVNGPNAFIVKGGTTVLQSTDFEEACLHAWIGVLSSALADKTR